MHGCICLFALQSTFFAIAMTGTVYSERSKQVITKDQQISPGEIVHIVLKRGIRKVVLGAYHTIAFHGGKQIITIYSPRVIKKGKTFLWLQIAIQAHPI